MDISKMILDWKILLLLFAILSLQLLTTLAERPNFLTKTQLNSNRECDENALLPEPPCCGTSKVHAGRIYGGEQTLPNEFPWMVHICTGNATHFGCGGASLINSHWILTAAHNVVQRDSTFEVKKVHLGIWNTKADPVSESEMKIVQIDQVIPHELYNTEKHAPEHDVALLHLTEPVTFTDSIKPICLPLNYPEINTYADQVAIVAGWGRTENALSSDILLKTSLNVWNSLNCQQLINNIENVLCAGGVEGIDACVSDSGGPLMLQLENDGYKHFYQIGVVSFGKECGKAGLPGFYSYIPAYVKWINDTMTQFN